MMVDDWTTLVFKLLVITGVLVTSMRLIKQLFDRSRSSTPDSIKQVIANTLEMQHFQDLLERSEVPTLSNHESDIEGEIASRETQQVITMDTEVQAQLEREIQRLQAQLDQIQATIAQKRAEIRSAAKSYAKNIVNDIDAYSQETSQAPLRTLFLEYMSVIFITAGILILAVLGILTGDQLSPILASIAGYVLGRAQTHTSQERS